MCGGDPERRLGDDRRAARHGRARARRRRRARSAARGADGARALAAQPRAGRARRRARCAARGLRGGGARHLSVGRTASRCRRPATPCSCRAIPRCCVDCSTTCSITRPLRAGPEPGARQPGAHGRRGAAVGRQPGRRAGAAQRGERLREPFQRAERSHAQGSGLGLSIVQAVVEAHHGTLDLSSLPEGGLGVCVTLPLAEALARTTPQGTPVGS